MPSLLSFLLLFLHLTAGQTETSVVEITVTTITQTFTAAASPAPLSTQFTNDLTFRTSLLNSTNFFRYEHSAPFVYWNSTLASYAQAYADKCNWAHSGGPYGENLAQGFANVTAAVDAWGNERASYDFSTSNPTGFSEQTGHFTQLVWKSTVSTGCGWTACNGRNGLDGVYLVCEYYPAGNVVGENNKWFISNVAAERAAASSGFNEQSATQGATGGTPPVSTASAASATATVGGGTSEASEIGQGRAGITALVVLLVAFVMGLGMS